MWREADPPHRNPTNQRLDPVEPSGFCCRSRWTPDRTGATQDEGGGVTVGVPGQRSHRFLFGAMETAGLAGLARPAGRFPDVGRRSDGRWKDLKL